jgi:hypothetical protein
MSTTSLQAMVIAALVVGSGVHLWHGHQRAAATRDLAALADSNGFVPVQMPDGVPRDTVLILAPINCPSDAAKRAETLAARLTAMGIPNVRRSNYTITNPTPAEQPGIQHAFSLSDQAPVVMLNGRGKGNPSVEEVATEYRQD